MAPTVNLRVDVVATADVDGPGSTAWQVWITQGPHLVVGLSAVEYDDAAAWPANRGRAYLQYVDSTAFFEPRWARSQITRAVVHGYLASAASRGVAWCHIFARQQPFYLFPASVQGARPGALGTPAAEVPRARSSPHPARVTGTS